MNIAVIHGPNLNLLGLREPDVYGAETLEDLEDRLDAMSEIVGCNLEFFQSNHEGALIDHIHGLRGQVDGIVINAGALTHTSIGLRDALVGAEIPFVEVHLSNVYARESFRHVSYLSAVAEGVIGGFGAVSYELAVYALMRLPN